MFKKNNPGCAADPTNCGCGGETPPCGTLTITVTVTDCQFNGEATEATVTVRGPSPSTAVVGSGTTSGGTIVVPVFASGDYAVTASRPRWVDASDTVTLASCAGSNNADMPLNFDTPADGYVCCGCPEPLPLTLNATSKWGAFTMTYDDIFLGYVGCQPISVGGVVDDEDGNPCSADATVTTGIRWTMPCDPFGGFSHLAGNYAGCAAADDLPTETGGACDDSGSRDTGQGFNSLSEVCSPLALHFSGGGFDEDPNLIFSHTDEVFITE